jgi:hypothetical protein
VRSIVTKIVGLLFLAGCGGATAAQPKDDAGSPDTGSTALVDSGRAVTADAGAKDSATTAEDTSASADSGGPAFPDGGVLPNGDQIVASDHVTLNGVTSDGYAVYTDTTANVLYAILLSGGAPISLGPVTSSTTVTVVGKIAFIWTVIGKYSGVGPLSIWTSESGLQMLGTRSYLFPVVSASGSKVLYLDNLVFTGSEPGDVFVANIDGTGKTKIFPGAQLDTGFNMLFAGETAVVSAAGPGDASIGNVVTEAFAPPSWSMTTLASGGQGAISADSTGTSVLVETESGLSVYPIAGGAPILIDPNGVGGTFTSNGSAVVYTSIATALLSSPATAAQPTMLVPSGFPNLIGLSPDNSWALGTVATAGFLGPGEGVDLYLASATALGPAQTLSMTANLGGYGYGVTGGQGAPVFTADSSHVLFGTDPTLTGLATLQFASPSGSSGPTFAGVWSFLPTTAGQVLFDDDYDPAGGVGANGSADIQWLDTNGSAASKVLVSQADANFFVTPDQTTLVYSWSYLSGKGGGVWTLRLP